MRARCLEICASGQRTQNQPTNQPMNQPPNLRRSVCGGYRRITLARISTPFPAWSTPHCHPPPLPNLFRLHIPSDLFSRAVSRSLLHLSPTTTASACIGTNLPRPRVFHNSFRPESIPPSRRVETVGTAVGVQRVQPSVLGLSFVSLVTAPHKGIAL